MQSYKDVELDWKAIGRHGLKPAKIFQSILFPVDFSGACRETAKYVRDLAQITGGRVTLLHVIPSRSASYGAADIYSDSDGSAALIRLKKAQLAALTAFRDQHFDQHCDIRVEFGSIPDRIIDFAEHAACDLIMMSCAATTELTESSTMSHVLREAPCPVWAAPRANRLRPFTGLHSIVCALSPSGISGEYVNEAVALSAVFRSRLTFASAVTADSRVVEPSRVLTLEQEYPEAGLDQLVAGSRCAVYVESGPVGHVVRHIAELQSADLVIINRRHTPDFGEHTHGHACEIVLESPCPVLSLPSKANTAAMHLVVEKYHQSMYAMYATA